LSGSKALAGAKNSKNEASSSKSKGLAATKCNGRDKVDKVDTPKGKGKDLAATAEKVKGTWWRSNQPPKEI
jgi:hypothetical protein